MWCRADIKSTGTFGGSCLQVAAKNEQLAMVKALVAAGADVNQPDAGGRTALIECARWNQPKGKRDQVV